MCIVIVTNGGKAIVPATTRVRSFVANEVSPVDGRIFCEMRASSRRKISSYLDSCSDLY